MKGIFLCVVGVPSYPNQPCVLSTFNNDPSLFYIYDPDHWIRMNRLLTPEAVLVWAAGFLGLTVSSPKIKHASSSMSFNSFLYITLH